MSELATQPLPADQALIWVALDSHTYALCHMTQTPRLDGFGPRHLEPVALYEYDPFQGQWLSHALTDANALHT